ncbi:LD-carboxypeptidase [Actinoplanes sp. LDG1-06]|uniref:LD-carboxypeptidase n=1 Tax=Paractinoplanes ovalisporus TaxID=2810368 RepID=A0ABS2A890_9ACTN|nr:LD-carboxypeptidase [Actinoplanes ovalisporus]MBM2615518.1 LD-carboxypeptidase [Actinoplanes ovalisporus]
MTGGAYGPLRWPRLRLGDRVRMVSPASFPEEEGWREWAAGELAAWGLEVDFGRHADDRFGYMAGRDDDRLADLEDAFRDPGVRAIITTRGGAGAYRIAPRVDPALVRADPKPIVGFSDITYLHLALLDTTGLVGVHGWMGATGCRELLFTAEPAVLRADPGAPSAAVTIPGRATGRLIGGNTNAVAGMIAAGLPSLSGAILCLEASHRPGFDQFLWQMARSGSLDGLRGAAIGDLQGQEEAYGEIRTRLGALGIPVLGGLPFGHIDDMICMPLGTPATIDTEAGTLTVESGAR